MSFEKFIQNFGKIAIASFNSGNYDSLADLMAEGVMLSTPELNLEKIQSPAVMLNGKDAVIDYWKGLREIFPNYISEYSFLKVGKKSFMRCYYPDMDMTLDVELEIDTYGKAYKIINHLVEK